jgi:hypothetical protein
LGYILGDFFTNSSGHPVPVAEALKWWVNGVGQLIVGLAGISVNSLSVYILLQKQMSTMFNHLLTCLAVSHSMVAITINLHTVAFIN